MGVVAACQVTVWPFAARVGSGEHERRGERVDPVGQLDDQVAGAAPAAERTAICAWVMEQGAALEQLLPVPVGET